jgi:hypothetical protein
MTRKISKIGFEEGKRSKVTYRPFKQIKNIKEKMTDIVEARSP